MSAACRNHSFISSLFVTLIMWVSENVTYTDLIIVKMNVFGYCFTSDILHQEISHKCFMAFKGRVDDE